MIFPSSFLPVLPFTVAAYCIGTGKGRWAMLPWFAAEQPQTWTALLDHLTAATCHFVHVLVDDGADLYQLFDSGLGC